MKFFNFPKKNSAFRPPIICFCILFMAGFSFSQNSLGFVNLPSDARGNSLSGADIAFARDAAGMNYNPALLMNIGKSSIMLSHFDWMNFKNENIGYAFRSPAGVAGIDARFIFDPSVRKTDVNGIDLGRMNLYVLMLKLGFAAPVISKQWIAGVNAKYIRSVLDAYAAGSFSADLGVLYLPDFFEKRLKVGLAVQNLGTGLKYKDENVTLPITGMLGASYAVLAMPMHKINVMANGHLVVNEIFTLPVGVEYGFMNLALVRLSYLIAKENIRSFSYGAGLNIRGLTADFAFLPGVGVSTISYAVTLGYRW